MEDVVTDRLLLRRWRDADRQPFARMNADPAVMEHFPALLSLEESDHLIQNIEKHFERLELVSFTVPSNVRSRGVMEKLGMTDA